MVAVTKGLPMPRPPMPDASHTFEDSPKERRFAMDLVRMVQHALEARSPDDTGRGQLILLDPTGAAWALQVDATGALSTTKLRG